jgi:3-oxosteroid 1-dehydrogenase
MTDQKTQDCDQTVDLLIVGSGAGAMMAALAAYDRGGDPLLIEKTDQYGGSSAMSGGSLWVPNNHLMEGTGIDDSPEEAMQYLREITRGEVPEDKLQAYVETSPEMVKYSCDHTQLQLEAQPEYADYYSNVPGAKAGARALEAARFDGRLLGNEEFLRMRPEHIQCLIMKRMSMTAREARVMFCRSPGWMRLTFKLMIQYYLDVRGRTLGRRDRSCTMGNGLVGALRRSLMDRGIPLWLETPARRLIVENGRVVGAEVDKQGRSMRIRATRGVILAAGGFEGSQAMREKYLPNPTRAEWTVANPNNTGDAINMGLELGAGIEFMDDAWWGPTTCVPGEEHARMLVIEKSLPGSIIVNKRGERIVNEAAPYIDIVKTMYAKDTPEAPSVPAYMVFDASYRKSYPFGPFLQSSQQPDSMISKKLLGSYLKKADTLDNLARQLGIDAEGLKATAAKIGDYASTGSDLDFNRGETIFDRYYGDENVKPNPCLGPLEAAPFYGIEVFAGELGTKGGLKTDARARVLKESGEVIPGLYAIGNCSSPVMGPTYAGAGATLGPAMTFGYIAAGDAIVKNE